MKLLRKLYNRLNFIKIIYNYISPYIYTFCGKKPWSIGYNEYKIKQIKKYIARSVFNTNKLPQGYGYRLDERVIEYPWLFSRISKEKGKLLDAGSVLNYDYLLNNHSLKLKNIFISTLSPEGSCYWKKGISYIYEDLRHSCFRDDFFNWIVSLSTIEHIGMDNTFLYAKDILKKENRSSSYLIAIKEYYRILKKGGILYLSFPFGKKKNHGWFQVFDIKMIDKVISVFSPSHYKEYFFKYKRTGWQVSKKEKAKDATYFDIHKQKKYDSDYAAASRAVACLELIK